MKTKMYTIHDSAIKAFITPHFSRTHGEAERNFRSGVNNPENGHLYASPENFTLYYIGEYDDETGAIETHAPMSITTGAQVKKSMTDNERQMPLRNVSN